jgi:hypothetical protein
MITAKGSCLNRTLWLLCLGFALAIFGSWVNLAHAGVVSCSAGTAGGGLSSCTGVQSCLTTLSPETLVRTLSGPAHIWQRWDVIPANGTVRLCQPDGWNSKQASGVIVAAPPPVDPSPPTAPEVQDFSALWWAPVTTNTDGTPAKITGYRLYLGTSPGVYAAPIPVQGFRYSLAQLAPGRYYAAVTAQDEAGRESAKTAEISFEVKPAQTPEPPKQFTCSTPLVTENKTVTLTCTLQ